MSNADEVTPRAEVLREAETLITGDRNHTYGTPTQNFTNIAALWNVQFAHLLKDDAEFTATDVALAQIHVKMGRMVAQPKRDNFVDIAGYSACGYETTIEPEPEPAALTGGWEGGTWKPFTGGTISTASGATLTNAEIVRKIQDEINRGQRWQS